MKHRSGYVKISRSSFVHPLFDKQSFCKAHAWHWLIAQACWQPTKFDCFGKIIELERGQLVVSIRQLADVFGWKKGVVERFLVRLKTETMIETHSETGKTVITICNYSEYQDDNKGTETHSETPTETGAGQEQDTNKDIKPLKKVKESNSSSELLGKTGGFDPSQIQEAFDDWNVFANHFGLSKCIKLTESRKSKIRGRLKDAKDFGDKPNDGFRNAIRRASQSSFLMGEKSDYKLTFDSFLGQKLFIKVMEGGFDDNNKHSSGSWHNIADKMAESLNVDEQTNSSTGNEATSSLDGALLIEYDEE